MQERIASVNSAVIILIALAERSYANQRCLQERIASANSMAGLRIQFPAQVVDGSGGGGMIGGGIVTAVSGDRLFNGVIVRTVFFMQCPMLS